MCSTGIKNQKIRVLKKDRVFWKAEMMDDKPLYYHFLPSFRSGAKANFFIDDFGKLGRGGYHAFCRLKDANEYCLTSKRYIKVVKVLVKAGTRVVYDLHYLASAKMKYYKIVKAEYMEVANG